MRPARVQFVKKQVMKESSDVEEKLCGRDEF